MLIALDPSSTKTGYAVFDAAGFPVDAGVLKPINPKHHANARIIAMIDGLIEVVAEHRPTLGIVEDTSGKVGMAARARGVNGAGLAIHGKAVGWMLSTLGNLLGSRERVKAVLENDWTDGVPKLIRANRTRYTFPHLEKLDDLDALDAVGVGHWWLTIGQHRGESTDDGNTIRRRRRRGRARR